MLKKIAINALVLGLSAPWIVHLPALAQANYPILAIGSTGESVGQLQATLKLLGFYQGKIDSTYSQSTLEAVAQFQTAAGITADGIAGPSTWQKLLPLPEDISAIAAIPEPESPAPEPPASSEPATSAEPSDPTGASASTPLEPPILRAEASGSAVSQLQKELTELGYYSGPIDGNYDEQTIAAVKKFQADQQILVDGVVGPSTWDALLRALNK
ncbi:MAG: peptidoglycan-binding domain-containing protein [Phormidesmis sp.]